jgi:hypothetical protein
LRRVLVNAMDEIEAGFEKLKQKIEESQSEKTQEKIAGLSEQIKENDAKLLSRMAKSAAPMIKTIGLNMLKMGKQDTKGELYDPMYYPKKMIILGKAESAAFRPDNPQKQVTDQFCVLSEEGKFFELMYSDDGFLTDSYLNSIDAKTAIDQYGYDVLFMLYCALRDYLEGEEALIEALEKVIGYVFAKKV